MDPRAFIAGLALLLALSSLAGCASVPSSRAGFEAVTATVMERTGHAIRWDQASAEDQDVTVALRQLLARELTAEDAVQVALLKNQNLQAAYEELGIAQAELVEAGLLRNPTLSAEVRFPKYHALPFEFDVTQSFLELLTLPLRKRAAGAAFEAAKQRVTAEVLTTAADVKAAFYRVQGAEQLVELRRTSGRATEASFDVAGRLHDAGNITDLALANERSLHEQAKIDLAKAERDALDAREELNALMGLWGQDVTWTVAPKLPDLPRDEVPLQGLESLAVSRRPDLGAERQEIETNRQSLGLARYDVLGDVSLGGHYERDTDGAQTAGPALTVPLPIFNQGQPAIAAAQARLRQSRHRYEALGVQVRAQVRRARNRMTAARDLAEYLSRVVVPLRHQIVQQTQLQFNAMQVGVFELLQAKQAEIDAGRDYVEAAQDYWVSRAELERAVGGRLAGAGTSAATPPTTERATTQPVEPEPHHHGKPEGEKP